MAPNPRTQREEQRRLSVRTLVIASVASVAAAAVTSRFSVAGSVTAAALTPVIVAIVSELLHRPSEKIAEKLTTERDALLPEAAGAGPPPQRQDQHGRLGHEERSEPPARDIEPGSDAPPVRVYRSERKPGRRRVVWRLVAITAAIAFAVAIAAVTLPELIAGESVGGNRDTTFFGGRGSEDDRPDTPQTTPEQQPTAPEQEEPPPTVTTPPPETTPTETEEQETTSTETAPAPD